MANKKIPATVFVSGLGSDICNPFINKDGKLHVIRLNQGTILQLDSVGNTRPLVATNGQPSSSVFSPDGILYTADFAHMAVLAYTEDGQQEMVVSVYEDKPLKGPNGIALIDGDIFFTDSGPFGETGLHAPLGSLFVISNSPSGQILKPISLNNLAYPAGIAVTKDKKFIYVAETMQNRVLRFFQRPAGVYHGSVFYTLSGGVGPSSLALDSNGNLYVGQFDVKGMDNCS
ncbi:SMP-30/gluconolactonase/LRE family protein [archaeon]|nr:MAG: SMP-30/gluconolactonase/LRE family protein [archaeon]